MPGWLFLAWLLVAFAVVADARPGGGETSSGDWTLSRIEQDDSYAG